MKMSNEHWHKGYKEVKNTIHNEMGINKEEILEVFRQVAKDEIKKIVSEKNDFIKLSIREIIQNEMVKAIQDHKYPKVTSHLWNYGYNGQGSEPFKSYVAGVLKEEIMKILENQFDVDLDIKRKSDKKNEN